jgi:ABC-type oligopeptide transport system ATPase subunit
MSKGGLINFYDLKAIKEMRDESHNPHFDDTNIEIPSRICIVGASGSGKSTCLMNFILKAKSTFGHITIVTKQQEPLYDYLEKQLKGKNITIHYDLGKLEEPKDFPNKELQNLLIFDDQIAEKNQRKIVEYFIRGRKIGAGITCCYLSQSYYQVPKTIRAQLSYIWLVKIGQKRDLNLILADSGGLVDKKTLMHLYEDATQQKFNFLKINLNTVDMNKKFSKNFIDFFILDGKTEEEEKK